MSKPMTKNRIAQLKNYADPNETHGAMMLELIAEVERLKKLAVPNRAPKTRTKSEDCAYVAGSNYEAMRIADDNGMSYGQRIYSKNKVDGDGYSYNDPSRERY